MGRICARGAARAARSESVKKPPRQRPFVVYVGFSDGAPFIDTVLTGYHMVEAYKYKYQAKQAYEDVRKARLVFEPRQTRQGARA